MKHHTIKIVTCLLGAAMLFTACEKVALEDGRMLLGSWGYEEYSRTPIMSFYESGVAEYYLFVPDCCGQSQTVYFNWTLTDKGHQVHFTAEGASTPTIKWELRKVTPDTLFVKERLNIDGVFSDAIDRTYVRIQAVPAE